MKVNENISYAKSILNKLSIVPGSPDHEPYLKIREICNNNNGYVGILTKLYYIDGVKDMEEIKSIYDVLKNSKIDISNINSLNYKQILDIFYNKFDNSDKDYKLIYKDDNYSYYQVYTYEGILKIGSPSWCIKTKKNWDYYIKIYPEQWVVVNNKYINRLISPNTNYLNRYENTNIPWVRFGISLNSDKNTYEAFNDNNSKLLHTNPDNWTFYGIVNTIKNLKNGIQKSYYDHFEGCELLINNTSDSWHKVVDKKIFLKKINIKDLIKNELYRKRFIESENEIYVSIPKYSRPIIFFSPHSDYFPIAYSDSRKVFKGVNFSGPFSRSIVEEFVIKNKDKRNLVIFYTSIMIKMGLIKLDEIEIIKKVNNWIILDYNEKFYIAINTNIGDNYKLPIMDLTGVNWQDDSLYWLINKDKLTPLFINSEITKEVINALKDIKVNKIRRFFDFI